MWGKIENFYFQSYRLKCRLCGGMKEKMKNALIIASVASMIDQFNRSNIKLLQGLGYHVDVACNYIEGSTCTKERIADLKRTLKDWEVNYFQIDFARNVTNFKQNRRAYQQLKILAKKTHYNLVHCHAPIGGVLGRIVFQKERKQGTAVIYTAHGFHFFQGAPLKNWMLYYPVEKFLSRWTDCLITINKEDYWRAKKKFHAKRIQYVPGVGVDLRKIAETKIDRSKKRRELGISEDAFFILSVGELSKRKNHKLILQALCNLKNKKICYVICGQGALENELKEFVLDYGLEKKVQFLGYRSDVVELYKSADLFVFPSLQEGLPVALMEAMASGVPCVASDIRGNRDLLEGEIKRNLIRSNQPERWAKHILYCIHHIKEETQKAGKYQKRIERFSEEKIEIKMKEIYQSYLDSIPFV